VPAARTSAALTWTGVVAGWAPSQSAAAPATAGEAIEVPEIVLVAVSAVSQSDVTDTPGANRSTQRPVLAHSGLVSAR